MVFRVGRGGRGRGGTPERGGAGLSDGFGGRTQNEGFRRRMSQIGSDIQFQGHEAFAESLAAEQAALREAYLGE